MASAPDLNIDYVANLARIALTAEEKAVFARQLGDVLAYVEKLKEVDVSQVQPTAHAFPLTNVWADDTPQPGLPADRALQNAPAKRDDLFVVPVVVE
jgi:aspartyl-tRNA(Asn)/glutamyl-tRNA(Gln) amidotransferase subunit C